MKYAFLNENKIWRQEKMIKINFEINKKVFYFFKLIWFFDLKLLQRDTLQWINYVR